jgi:hypothetical protein
MSLDRNIANGKAATAEGFVKKVELNVYIVIQRTLIPLSLYLRSAPNDLFQELYYYG